MNFKKLKIYQDTTIKYSELRIKRLGKGWVTDCNPYYTENNYSYYRSDCINDCYQDKMSDLCKVQSGLFMSTSLIRRDYLSKVNDLN